MKTLSQFLAENIDSHELVSLDVFNTAAQEVGNATFVQTIDHGWQITMDDGKRVTVRGRTVGEINRAMSTEKVGPKGLTLAPGADLDEIALPGYVLSAMIARQLLGEAPGDQFFGRGTAHRANLTGLKEAGY